MARFLLFRPLHLLGAVLVVVGTARPLLAAPVGIPLECRRVSGPWQPCTMLVEQVGQHWWLVIGAERFEFFHNGSGRMRLRADGGSWRVVESRWGADSALCWDDICARGEIPLD